MAADVKSAESATANPDDAATATSGTADATVQRLTDGGSDGHPGGRGALADHPAGRMDRRPPARDPGSQWLDVTHTVECGGEGDRTRRRRRTRKRKKRSRNRTKSSTLTVFHSNIRGFKSKQDSLEKILEIVQPDIVNLNETNVKGRNKVYHKGYHSFVRNRKEKKHMGGVSTAVKNDLKAAAVKVMEGEEDDELLITRLEHTTPPINIVNVYGEIEGRCKNEEIQERFERLKYELDRIRRDKEGLILIGDLNKKIGSDNLGVKGNNPKVSYGGNLVRSLVESGEYFLANNTPEAVGGPFTREEPADAHLPWENRRKSCLDLVAISKNLKPFYSSLKVNSRREITPKRIMMKKGRLIEKYTDHYSLVLQLKNLPRTGHQQKKEVRWNLMKPGGWKKYRELSDEKAVAMESVIMNKDLSVEEATTKIEKIETKLKFQAFGKSSIRGKQGGGFKTNTSLGEDRGSNPSQGSPKMRVGRQNSPLTQPS